jgi:hypothetical protein
VAGANGVGEEIKLEEMIRGERGDLIERFAARRTGKRGVRCLPIDFSDNI